LSEGATQYKFIQMDSDGALLSSNDFGILNSTIVYNLEKSIEYIFTIYSGNENGFDLSEGRTAILSTDCSPFFLSFFLFLFPQIILFNRG